MYSLDHINRIQNDVNNLNKYAIEVGQQISKLRKYKYPNDDSSVVFDEYQMVNIYWSESICQCCADESYCIEYPILYLAVEKSQYLEAETIKLKQEEETKRLKELTEKKIRDKKKKEEEFATYTKLRVKYDPNYVMSEKECKDWFNSLPKSKPLPKSTQTLADL